MKFGNPKDLDASPKDIAHPLYEHISSNNAPPLLLPHPVLEGETPYSFIEREGKHLMNFKKILRDLGKSLLWKIAEV